jgi:glucose/arabinose dehydrogenase
VIRRAALAVAAGLALAVPAQATQLVQVGSFSSPVSITGAPGDEHRVYVVEQRGVIRELVDGVLQPAPFLDIHDKVAFGGEQGLLSMAIDPAAPTHVYVYYASATDGHIHIDQFTAPTPDAVVGAGTTIVDIPHPGDSNHYGGQLQFGPDRKLYVATGDGGGVGDVHHNAQDVTSLLGKLLRINVDGSAPADNPFSNRVWALGLRNPWRWSFDRATGALAIADVGQAAWEEIDFAPSLAAAKGVNYGWNMREGMHAYSSPTDTPGPNCCTDPLLEHSHVPEGWAAIVGGYVVRDPSLPELAGRYVYGDNAKGDLYAATLATGGADDGATGLHVADLSGFGEDAAGHVYAASLDGPVYRLAANPVPPAPGDGTGGGGGGAGAADVTAPRLTVRAAARQHVLRRKRFVATVTCDEQCRLTIAAKRSSTRHVTAAAKARIRVVLRPSRRALRLWSRIVGRHHKLVVRVHVRAADGAGNVATRAVRVRVLR